MKAGAIALSLCFGLGLATTTNAQPNLSASEPSPRIVAAENFYGDVAAQVAGPAVSVTSILRNPDQDPHLFEASPSTARALAGASIVIYNGVGYDPWMARILRATHAPKQQVIVVGELLRRRAGVNPHLWYDPDTMPQVASALAEALARADPPNAGQHRERSQAFAASLAPLRDKIAAMRSRYTGTAVTATEPVFGYMAAALGLVMRNERFQLSIMNGSEPRASDVAAFEADLKSRGVRVLFYNSQATGSAGQRMLRLAQQAGIPIVGVTETEPAGTTYQAWMMSQLDALEAALAQPKP